MTDSIDQMLVSVRADTSGFARDIQVMRGELEGPLAAGADKAGRALEASLSRFIQTGKFGFEDLRRTALAVMNEIARASISSGMQSLGANMGGSGIGGGFGGGIGGGSGGGGMGNVLTMALQLAAMAFGGSPGRATGGPVTPGRAYKVGENGPEWFVPTSSGRVEANGGQGGGGFSGAGFGGGRDIRITVNVHGGDGQRGPERMQATGRQIARAVRAAIEDAG